METILCQDIKPISVSFMVALYSTMLMCYLINLYQYIFRLFNTSVVTRSAFSK